MAERAIRLPDVGEGVAEAELVEWHVKIGELVREDDILAAVMTDKATVEIPSPIAGRDRLAGRRGRRCGRRRLRPCAGESPGRATDSAAAESCAHREAEPPAAEAKAPTAPAERRSRPR